MLGGSTKAQTDLKDTDHYIKTILMTTTMMTVTMRMKTAGSIYGRIYKMPATWIRCFTDTLANPHNNFAMKASSALFSLEKM